ADRAPHGGGDVAQRALSRRAAARAVLRSQPAAGGRSRPRARRLGDDRLDARGDRGARARHRSRQTAARAGQDPPPGRHPLPLGSQGPRHRRCRQRAAAARARPQRAHLRVQGLDLRHPARPAPARRGPEGAGRGLPAARGGEHVKLQTHAWPSTYDGEAKPRKGFFTDTSVCIGCKACEVACKEWNHVPQSIEGFTGNSYDNSVALGADRWRHVALIEQRKEVGLESSGGSLVQQAVCNGCGYCVPACPFGVLDQREEDGRVWKCTLCYDRLKDDREPACAHACPTNSIKFGDLDDLREVAEERLKVLTEAGAEKAQLYLHDAADGIGGAGAFFLLLDEPEVYGLPPDPVDTTRDLGTTWAAVGAAALGLGAAIAVSVFGGRR